MISEPPQIRDVMTNCRSALESLVEDLSVKEGLVPQKWFSKDLLVLAKKNPMLIDDALVKLLRGAYDFLSLKGPHPYSTIDQSNLSEVLFGMEHTYSILSLILLRYTAVVSSSH